MCFDHIKSDPRPQKYVKLPLHWELDEGRVFNKMVSRMTRRRFVTPTFVYKKIYEIPCAHTKVSQITRQNRLLWARHTTSEVSILRTPPHHGGLGRECNVNVCVLGSDLMW